jgi:hypothetical protein
MSDIGCCGTGVALEIKPKLKTIRIEARAGEHTLYVDQAVSAGGDGAGANPVEYLFASLGQAALRLRRGSSPTSRSSI